MVWQKSAHKKCWIINYYLFILLSLFFDLCADHATGFGGKHGIQKDRQDQSALGFDYQPKAEKHASQKGIIDYKISVPLPLQ